MLEDIVTELENYMVFGDSFARMNLTQAALNNARVIALARIKAQLINAAEEALETIDEFNHPDLHNRLIENLSKDEHYFVSPDLGSAIVFNPELAGSWDDLVSGQVAGGGGGPAPQPQRLFCWKYGIYIPEREGGRRASKFDDYPTYTEVIQARLSAWGDKAPYWMFLEYGNAGGAPAYPSFSGTGFIARVQGMVPRIIRRAADIAEREMLDQMELAIEEQLSTPTRRVAVELGYIPFAPEAVSKVGVSTRLTKAGEIYYQLRVGGRFGRRIEAGQFVEELGGVFTP